MSTLTDLQTTQREIVWPELTQDLPPAEYQDTLDVMRVTNLISKAVLYYSDLTLAKIHQLIARSFSTASEYTATLGDGMVSATKPTSKWTLNFSHWGGGQSSPHEATGSIYAGAAPEGVPTNLGDIDSKHPLGGAAVAALLRGVDKKVDRLYLASALLEGDTARRAELIRPYLPSVFAAFLDFKPFQHTFWRIPDFKKAAGTFSCLVERNRGSAEYSEAMQAHRAIVQGFGDEDLAPPKRGNYEKSAFSMDEFAKAVFADSSKYSPADIWSICVSLCDILDVEYVLPELVPAFAERLSDAILALVGATGSLTKVVASSTDKELSGLTSKVEALSKEAKMLSFGSFAASFLLK